MPDKPKPFAVAYLIMKVFVASLLMLMTALIFYQIVMRYCFNMAPDWTEEIARYLFIWSSFVAGGMGVYEHVHIGIDAAVNQLPAAVKRITQFIVQIIIFCLGCFLIYYGSKVVGVTYSQLSPAVGVPMGIVYAAAPAMGILMVLFSSNDLFKLIRGGKVEASTDGDITSC
ncbi:MAG: TRAP transporter small permease [Methylobacteriaceae bacterium]|jgi:TRAP-type C4-dicarboxylate transport system permease small subunit|nr:TRAP transporter small permease [Methylobacteriaceae bacterium]